MRVEVWNYSVRITNSSVEADALVDDSIVVTVGSKREEVIGQVKRLMKLPEGSEMNVRLCCRGRNADLLVSELLPAGPSNEELAS